MRLSAGTHDKQASAFSLRIVCCARTFPHQIKPFLSTDCFAMPVPEAIRPVLADVKAALHDLYGDRLEQVILYGSYARGDTHAESDVDVLVVLNGPVDSGREIRRMSDIRINVGLGFDVALSLLPASTEQVNSASTLWLKNVRQEGIQI
jgi:uncharacterized protein